MPRPLFQLTVLGSWPAILAASAGSTSSAEARLNGQFVGLYSSVALSLLGSARILALVLIAIAACSPRIDQPEASAFRVGAARSEILTTFGKPAREASYLKSDDSIWGAIEEFWSRVPLGSTVEVWSYPVRGGTIELYFIDGSNEIQGIGFAPTGAIYEPSS